MIRFEESSAVTVPRADMREHVQKFQTSSNSAYIINWYGPVGVDSFFHSEY